MIIMSSPFDIFYFFCTYKNTEVLSVLISTIILLNSNLLILNRHSRGDECVIPEKETFS